MRIQDIQTDVLFSRKIAELGEIVLQQNQALQEKDARIKDLERDLEAFKSAERARTEQAIPTG